MRLRGLALAAYVTLGAAVAGLPVYAVEPPSGSKNFSAPSGVPNYFSNESGPFQGGAIARPASPGAGPVYATPAPRGRSVATSRHRGRYASARGARGNHRQAARGRAGSYHYTSHARGARTGSAKGKAVTAGTRTAPSKGKPARAHG